MSHNSLTQYEADMKTGAPDSILSGLWRTIRKDFDIDDAKVEDLIFKYANQDKDRNANQKSQLRGNLRGEINKEGMTWDTFAKAMRVLRAKDVSLTFKLKHLRLQSVHSIDLELSKERGKDEPSQLSMFFHAILHDLGITANIFEKLLRSYMVRSRIPVTAANRTQVRGNLKKELMGPDLSWKGFVKGMCYLCVTEFEILVTITLKNGRCSHHIRTFALNEMEDFQTDLQEIFEITKL